MCCLCLQMTFHPNFSPSPRISISLLTDRQPFLSLSLSPLMDGQIMYIQSSSAPDAVRGCDKSPGGGTERSGAERRNGVTKRTRHLENTQKKKHKECSREREREAAWSVCIAPWAWVCMCASVCVCAESKHPLLCTLGYCVGLWLTVLTDWFLHSTPANDNDKDGLKLYSYVW